MEGILASLNVPEALQSCIIATKGIIKMEDKAKDQPTHSAQFG